MREYKVAKPHVSLRRNATKFPIYSIFDNQDLTVLLTALISGKNQLWLSFVDAVLGVS